MHQHRFRTLLSSVLAGSLCLVAACGPKEGPPDAKTVATKVETTAASAENPSGLSDLKQKIKGADEAALRNLGVALWTMGASNAASYVLARAVELNLDDWLAWNDLGAVLNTLKRYQLALEALEIADSLDPNNPLIQDNLAAAEDGLGHDAKAKAHLKAALAISPKDPQANLSLGRLLSHQGDATAAAPYLAKARSLVYTQNNDYQTPDPTGSGTDPIPLLPYIRYPAGGPPAVDLGTGPPQLPAKYSAYDATFREILKQARAMGQRYSSLMDQANAIGVGSIPIVGTTAYQKWFYGTQTPPFTTLPNLQEKHWDAITDIELAYEDRGTKLLDALDAKMTAQEKDLQAQLTPIQNDWLADTSCNGITDPVSAQACQQAVDQHYCSLEAAARQATYSKSVSDYKKYYSAIMARLQEAADQMAWNVGAFTNADDYQAMTLAIQAEVVMDVSSIDADIGEVGVPQIAGGLPIDCGPPDPALAQKIKAALSGGSQRQCNSRFYVPIPPLAPVVTFDVQCDEMKVDVEAGIFRAKLDYDAQTHEGMVFAGVGKSFGFGKEGGVLKTYGPSVGAEAGVYFAFDGDSATDFGVEADASASLGGPILKGTAGARLGIASGLTTFLN